MISNKPIVFLIQLDALSYSYFTSKQTPLLHQFAQNGIKGRLETMLAYDGINASIFTGTWPEQNNIWTRYKLAHNWLRRPYFTHSIKPGTFHKHNHYNHQPTIFGILRQHGLSSGYFFGKIEEVIKHFQNKNNLSKHQFHFIHTLGSLDEKAHQYGPFHSKTLSHLRQQDKLISQLVKTLPQANFIFFSDHGMAKVTKSLDIAKFLTQAKTRKTMTVFVDSTMVRVWGNQVDLNFAKNYFKKFKTIKLLTLSDLKKLKLNFKHNSYGDLIFLAQSGVVFYPDNFNNPQKIKGMHGYPPGLKDLDGIIVLKGPKIPKKNIKKACMVDLFPTILKIFNLPVPVSNAGRSLI